MGFIKKKTQGVQSEQGAEPAQMAELLPALQSDDAGARRSAVRVLAAYGDAAPALLERLHAEADASVREAIFTALVRIASDDAVAGLVECLRSEDAPVRNEAIEALKSLPQQVAPIMGRLLAEPDADVRIFAVNVLESLRHPQVESWLIEVVAHDRAVNVVATAVDLLGEVGTVAAEPALAGLEQRFPGEPYIAFAARLALKRIGKA